MPNIPPSTVLWLIRGISAVPTTTKAEKTESSSQPTDTSKLSATVSALTNSSTSRSTSTFTSTNGGNSTIGDTLKNGLSKAQDGYKNCSEGVNSCTSNMTAAIWFVGTVILGVAMLYLSWSALSHCRSRRKKQKAAKKLEEAEMEAKLNAIAQEKGRVVVTT